MSSSKSLSEQSSYIFGALSDQNTNTAEFSQPMPHGAETQIQPMAGSVPSVDFGIQGSADIYCWQPLTGTWNADFGTDGPAASDSLVITVTRPGCPAFTSSVTPGNDVDVVIEGITYGTFRIDTNGTFVFQPADETHAMLQISLTAVDSDGDITKSETLTVRVSDPEGGPGISHLGNITLDEANLPGGTNPDADALTKEITLGNRIVDIRTDIGGWVKDGDVFVLKSPEKYDADGNLINGFGELRYNADTKTLTYTLTNPMAHALGENAGMDVFLGVVVRARYQPEYPLDVIINIKDDGPLLTFGNGSDDEIRSGDLYNGNWHHAFGADGPADVNSILLTVRNAQGESSQTALTIGVESSVIINGVNYGTIFLKDDGSFSFRATPNTDNTLTFNLTVTDGDGDSASSAPFSLVVSTPVSPPVDHLEATVSEADLLWGTNGTSGDTVKNIAIPAGFTVDASGWEDAGNGLYVKYNGNSIGYLTYDKNTNTLTYTLGASHSHGDPAASGADDVFKDGFKVTLADDKGNLFELDAIIDVLDDAPLITMDAGSGEVQSGHVFIASWSFHYGADGVDISGTTLRVNDGSNEATFTVQYWQPFDVVVGGVYYGKAMISDAGEYIFQAAPNLTANLNLAIGITDGDGDFREANDGGGVNINIVPATPPDLSDFGSKPNEWWSEAYLPDGTQGLDWSELTKHIEIPEGYAVDVSGWIHLGGDGDIYQLNGHFGYLKYSPEWNVLAYQLVARADHPNTNASGASDTVTDDFPVYIVDSMGNSWGATLNLQVRDDAPSVEFGGNASEATSGYEYEGDWQAVFGADGASATGALELKVNNGTNEAVFSMLPDSATAIVINGVNYGTLTLHSGSGKYTFVSAPNLDAKLSFVLAATDGDGDKALSNDGNGFEITITPPTQPITEITTAGEYFDEGNLPTGTHSNDSALTKVIVMPQDYSPTLSASEGWSQSGAAYTKDVTCGSLRYENGILTYTLSSPTEHSGAGRDSLNLNAGQIRLEDAKGNTFLVNVIVPLNDDAPIAPAGSTYNVTADGSSLTGTLNILYGADGKAATDHLVVEGYSPDGPAVGGKLTYTLATGTLILDVNTGAYSYQAKGLGLKESYASETIRFTATDGDGDTASTSLTFNVSKPSTGIDKVASASVDEAGLNGGAGQPAGTQAYTDLEFGAISLPTGWKVVGAGGTSVDYGRIVMKDGSWSFELTSALKHVAPPSGTADKNTNTVSPLAKPTVIAEDAYGNQYEIPVVVTVVDDILAADNFYGSTQPRPGTNPDDMFYDYPNTISFQQGSSTGAGTMVSSSSQFSQMGITSIKAAMMQLNKDGSIVERTDLNAGNLYRNGDGLLIKGSSIDKTNDRYNELNYRPVYEINGKDVMFGMTTPVPNINGKEVKYGLSEAVVMDLDGLATTIQLKLSEFYGSERESGQIVFYRYNAETKVYDEVTRQKFSNSPSDKSGYFAKEINISPGVFDRVVVMCTDNGNRSSIHDYDNSDFNIQSIKFPATSVVHYEQGQVAGRGADGVVANSYKFSLEPGTVVHTLSGNISVDYEVRNGVTITSHVIGIKNGVKMFEAFLTQSGQWDYFQYTEFTAIDSNGKEVGIPLRFGMMDSDGDYCYANIVAVDPNGGTNPGPNPGTVNYIYGTEHNDYITGTADSDVITGREGADLFLFHPGEGNDTIADFSRDEGDVVVKVGNSGHGQISGDFTNQDVHVVQDVQQGHLIAISESDNQNHLIVGAGPNPSSIAGYDNILKGGNGDDVIYGGDCNSGGQNFLVGGAGNDYIIGGNGNDIVQGGVGNDTIFSGAGNDTIYGEAGNDYLNAGSGNNIIYGGSGTDTFAWNKSSLGGKDQIGDFMSLEGDRLCFSDLLSEGESLAQFFATHISDLKINAENKLAFTIMENGLSKEVEIQFQAGDTYFAENAAEYHAATSSVLQEHILTNFLISISTQ